MAAVNESFCAHRARGQGQLANKTITYTLKFQISTRQARYKYLAYIVMICWSSKTFCNKQVEMHLNLEYLASL